LGTSPRGKERPITIRNFPQRKFTPQRNKQKSPFKGGRRNFCKEPGPLCRGELREKKTNGKREKGLAGKKRGNRVTPGGWRKTTKQKTKKKTLEKENPIPTFWIRAGRDGMVGFSNSFPKTRERGKSDSYSRGRAQEGFPRKKFLKKFDRRGGRPPGGAPGRKKHFRGY